MTFCDANQRTLFSLLNVSVMKPSFIFDNCITLHNRQGSPIERVAYREPCDYAQLIPDGYNYYSQEPYKTQFEEMRKDIQEPLGVKSIAEQNMVFKKYIQPKFPKREWKNNDLVR